MAKTRNQRLNSVLVHRQRKIRVEGLMDMLKPSPKGVARIKARHYDRIATKLAHRSDEEGTKKFHRADSAYKRYQRIADGKKPFGADV